MDDRLRDLPQIVRETPPAELPDLLGEIARAQALVLQRLSAIQPVTTTVGEFMTVAEAAAELRVNVNTVRGWIAAGRLQVVELPAKDGRRDGRAVRIRRADLARVVRERGRRTT